jgi:transposase
LPLFIKITPRTKGGKTYYYAELVEAYRQEGKHKHRRILYLGSVDEVIAARLKIAFSKDFDSFTNIEKLTFGNAVCYGDFFLINSICEQVAMFETFQRDFTTVDKHTTVETALNCVKAMLFQRLIQPESKLALTEWMEDTPIRHFFDHGQQHTPDLETLYRSLEVLAANFSFVEQSLFSWAERFYDQNMKELYYDITSSYFEGHRCIIAEYGYSRDHRKDREQIVIGLVTTPDGFPIKCDIHPGNTADKTTVAAVVEDLLERYPIKEFVFVGDRGMLTDPNLEAIRNLKQQYVMALPRAWSKKLLKDDPIAENMMEEIADHLYAKFLPDVEKERYLLCLNTEKRTDDTEYRSHCLESIREQLTRMNAGIGTTNKKITTRDEAMKRVGAILQSNKSGKYFDVKTRDSDANPLGFELEFGVNAKKVASDQRLDGTFVIQTNQLTYDGAKLVNIYKNLNQIENAFRIIKNDLDIRPMYHWKEVRVKGHVYLCVLAYFVIAAIEYLSKKKGIKLSARKILRSLSEIKLIQIELPGGERRFSLTTSGKDHQRILNALGINKITMPRVV